MNALLISPKLGVRNIVRKKERCNCEYHRGMVVRQSEADLPNGVHFIVVVDDYCRLSIGGSPLEIISPDCIEDKLWEALGG